MTRKNVQLRGILAAVTTPFTADGSQVDEAALRRQVERLVAAGIHGLVPTGTTGEFTSLTPAEYRRVIEVYVETAAGRVPVLLHLLAPNYRPQQVTQDLASFWKNTYPEVRKELAHRYPKHSWPLDPWTATPQRKGPSQKT